MMISNEISASSDSAQWQSIKWKAVEAQVLKLQMRIAKAIREGKYGKAKALQWILTHSRSAKILAVKRVSQNKGSKTAGIDGIIWNSDSRRMKAVNQLSRQGYKAKPLRRIYIPKKNGKLRPLGIPCMIDRAQQALHLLALEPISETLADPNSYGFRPKRATADAITQCYICLAKKHSPQWILEGDIKACFDKIGHQWLMENIQTDKRMLKQWLQCGFMDKALFYKTEEGTPQGGIISPTLMVLTMSGLEQFLKATIRKKGNKINFIGYADDFIVTGATKELLEHEVKPLITKFLEERGLTLSDEKTRVTHITNGFDFLGFNVRKYNGKFLTKPSKSNVLLFLRNMRELIKKNLATPVNKLISMMNPKLRGWANYYHHSVAQRTFSYVSHQIFLKLWQWAEKRHPKKGKRWIANKYFLNRKGQWQFHGWKKIANLDCQVNLVQIAQTPIRRHVKIRGKATPYDPAYVSYFKMRSQNKRGRNSWFDTSLMPI
ncbi:group II intron reverse transcriptase/maturase [Vibrio alginolyticus]|uniref:group II intron reverse transcriptase/maturase n=1 Tax=Vibrio alginolyticus TaxID=663 RepID=UPI000722E267|nr:group II intron reverse transcriptase/maturase [Vibrio alginolyticus]ALR95368.1 group II intron reverse transcriptase/maturase [Vibrio alginolyticus]ALR95767.1 group II intron reverse transcriptase/maturase [Vibrio alginolyticus]MBY7711015.1 group II intron reverse transcriptase/maturase [Vibrio alginolyticus]